MALHTNTAPAQQKASMLPYVVVMVFVSFAGYIGFMVYGAMQSDVNLVSKDYYAEELAYSQRMQQQAHTQQLETPIQIVQAVAAEQLMVQVPAELLKAQGTVTFFRPSDHKLDFQVPLKLNEDGVQPLSTTSLQKGLWRVQLSLKVGEKEYYQVQDITL